MTTAIARPDDPITGSADNAPAIGSESAAPPNAPARIPTRVIPIWTVERKRSGAAARSKATPAPRLPWSARACSRAGRAETTDSSEAANTPLIAINTNRIRRLTRITDAPPHPTRSLWGIIFLITTRPRATDRARRCQPAASPRTPRLLPDDVAQTTWMRLD